MKQKSAEIWLPVVGYEGWYEVSSLGYVKRVKKGPATWKGRMLTPVPDKGGYLRVGLWKFSRLKNFTVHKLVAVAFIGPYPKGMEVNHIDLDKSNNTVSNLEYVTPKRNVQHAVEMGARSNWARGEDSPSALLTTVDVINIRQMVMSGTSQRAVAKQFGVHYVTIHSIVHGKTWKHIPFPSTSVQS